MKKREDMVQKFSTYLSFRDYNSSRKSIWLADPQLERQMKRLVHSDPKAKEEFWARHFLKIVRGVTQEEGSQVPTQRSSKEEPALQESFSTQVTGVSKETISTTTQEPLRAGRHITAYLQEACLWAAQKSYQRFAVLRHKYPLEEYFQIANSAVNPPVKLFKNFNFEYHQTNIEGYAKTAIVRFINNTIYQQDLEAKRDKFSDFGLLKDLSNKELRESLLSQGVNQLQIESYCLLWQCLDEIFQPNQTQGSRSLKPPDSNHLQQITSRYNQRCNQLNFAGTPASPDKITEMLSTCIQAAREHRTRRFLPLEDYENITDSMPTPWDTLMQTEERDQVQQVVSRLFSAMPEAGQTMLKLGQGLNLTQTEMATVLKNKYPELQKQYQVARQLAKYSKSLLKDFVNEWRKINPDIDINDEKDIESIKDSLDECLQNHCEKIISYALDKLEQQWTNQEKLLLFNKKINLHEQTTDKQNSISLSEATKRIVEVKENLAKLFKNELEASMGIATNSLDLVNNKVTKFIDEWLKNKQFILNSRNGR